MKKLFLALSLLAASLFGTAAFAKTAQPDFSETLSKATLAVYTGKQVCDYKVVDGWFGSYDVWGCKFESHFTCTATVIDANGGGGFAGLTAGHCFSYEALDKGWKYYVSDALSEKPVLHEIHLIKFASDDRYDYAVFEFQSLRNYPVIEILKDQEEIPAIGTPVLNANFSLGVVKQVIEGKVVSKQITYDEGGPACSHMCKSRYFVSIGVGPGASGSAVVDASTHKIVGMVEAVFPSTQMATIVMPMGTHFVDFMDDASAGIRSQAPPNGEDIKDHITPKKPTLLEAIVLYFKKHWM